MSVSTAVKLVFLFVLVTAGCGPKPGHNPSPTEWNGPLSSQETDDLLDDVGRDLATRNVEYHVDAEAGRWSVKSKPGKTFELVEFARQYKTTKPKQRAALVHDYIGKTLGAR